MRTPTWRKIALAGMMKLGRHRGLCVETNGLWFMKIANFMDHTLIRRIIG
jgi:hypothetical protein